MRRPCSWPTRAAGNDRELLLRQGELLAHGRELIRDDSALSVNVPPLLCDVASNPSQRPNEKQAEQQRHNGCHQQAAWRKGGQASHYRPLPECCTANPVDASPATRE